MCGIAGIISLDGTPLDGGRHQPILTAMGDAIHHRGPDETRLMLWESVGFIFKRLSIVDIDGGHQPFETPDGQVSAMINGEIFNHQDIRHTRLADAPLHTRSDCEVIPFLYLERELGLFDEVNGMFAAAILDRRKKRVLLGRDRLGVKPLFYSIVDRGRTLVFASELKGLFAHPDVPRNFDWNTALGHDGARGTVARELSSGFLGIERVPAASLLDISLDDGSLRLHRYWALPAPDQDDGSDSADRWIDDYGSLLEDSVRLRLMADTQFGLFLSGGIDSAVIAAMAARHASFPTFSVLSQSTVGSGDAAASRFVAESLGLPNHQVSFDEFLRPLVPDDWRRVLWTCELWKSTAEQLYKYFLHSFAKARYPALKVILLGQGSDEWNGGYTEWTLKILARDGTASSGPWDAVGDFFDAIETEDAANQHGYYRTYGDLIDRRILTREFINRELVASPRRSVWEQYVGYYRENLDYHLWHEDRTASAHSIENRVPFMDYRLVELVARAPRRLHKALFTDKAILRRAALPLLPPAIANRPKGPFFYGTHQHHTFRMVHALLTANGGEIVEQSVAGSRLSNGPLDGDRIIKYAAEIGADPKLEDINRLMYLVNMGLLAEMSSRCPQFADKPIVLPVADIAVPPQTAVSSVVPAGNCDATELTDDMVVALSPHACLLEVRRGGAGASSGSWYLSGGKHLDVRIDSPNWLQFLMSLDGYLSIGSIISTCRLNRARIWKLVREALQSGHLVIAGRSVPQRSPPA